MYAGPSAKTLKTTMSAMVSCPRAIRSAGWPPRIISPSWSSRTTCRWGTCARAAARRLVFTLQMQSEAAAKSPVAT